LPERRLLSQNEASNDPTEHQSDNNIRIEDPEVTDIVRRPKKRSRSSRLKKLERIT
jgi:hypothetical protein